MSKFNFDVAADAVTATLDLDQDGKNSILIKAKTAESVAEVAGIISGKAKFEGSDVSSSFEGAKLKIGLDIDGDSENSAEIHIDLAEIGDELLQEVKARFGL